MSVLMHVSDAAAGYAFGALTGPERDEVALHIATCQECAEIIREAEEVAALLPFSVTPYRAPSDLKRMVLDLATAGPEDGIEDDSGAVAQPERADQPLLAATLRRLIPAWPWSTILLRTVPWTLAVIGWLVVAALVIYSHGQADRITTTSQDDQATIASLMGQRDQAETIQQFLLTPGVVTVPMVYKPGVAPHTNVVLFEVPGYIHAVVGARGLAVLSKNKTYAVWARKGQGPYVAVGTLTTAGPRAEGVSVVVAPLPFDQYSEVGITIATLPVPKQPAQHLAFVATLPA